MSVLPAYETLSVQDDAEGVRTITLNRPERRNAINVQLGTELHDCVQRSTADHALRVIVLTGAGHFFCAGGDVEGMASSGSQEYSQAERDNFLVRNDVARLLDSAPQLTVAVLNGSAAGAGLSLALACDFRIAKATAKLTTAFIRVALSGDYGCGFFLRRLVGPAKARELAILSPVLTASQALAAGLLTQVHDDAEFDAKALEFIGVLRAAPAVAAQGMKRNLRAAEAGDLAAYLVQEAENHFRSKASPDHAEATEAFVAKRPPKFARGA